MRFEHSIFALPFAYLGAIFAANGIPATDKLILITLAMVAARTAAMGANRIIDLPFDRENPRTSGRTLPARRMPLQVAYAIVIVSSVIFLLFAYLLNPLSFALAPIALFILIIYSYTKRWTTLTHLILGFADGIAPFAGWVAVTGILDWRPLLLTSAVTFWVGGFDIYYAVQDVDYDKQRGLFSYPSRLGIKVSLLIAFLFHILVIASLLAFGAVAGAGILYYLGSAIAGIILIWEYIAVRADLSRINVAFFNANGLLSILFFLFALCDILLA